MELAVNTFSKGLQTDTHPMVQGTDTLSDALNATFITMNGNEVVLQNDMGNRRVDNAYLPAGYEPVGIKEYGGIIYLALYNPITNRSLIGSFPSPERDISGTDNNEDISFNLKTLFDEKDNLEEATHGGVTVKYLKNDTFLIPISSSTALHPGDKFTLYWDLDLKKESEDILIKMLTSNWDLTSQRDLKRKYTLSLGILNSQNEFVDITPSLERFNDNGDLIKTEFKSEEDKFNTGYFICPKAKPLSSESTLDRDSIASNVYSYKLVGPLYLKAEISHVKDFGYSVRFSRDSSGLVTITVLGTSHYDFWIFLIMQLLGERLNSPLEEPPETVGNLFLPSISSEFIPEGIIISNPDLSVDKVSKTLTQTTTLKFTPENGAENINLYLDVCGPKSFDMEERYYLKNLSEVFTFNINDIGTHKIKVNGWRYLITPLGVGEDFQCSIDFSVYITNSEDIKYTKLEVYIPSNISGSPNDPIYSIEDPQGLPSKTETITFNQSLVLKEDYKNYKYYDENTPIGLGWLFPVYIEYTKVTTDSNLLLTITTSSFRRFILTTELFNDCYDQSLQNFVQDFEIFLLDYPEENLSTSLRTIREEKLNIKPIINTSNMNQSSYDRRYPRNIFRTFNPDKEDAIYIKEYSTEVTTEGLLLEFNRNLYPGDIELKSDYTFEFIGFSKDLLEVSCDILENGSTSRISVKDWCTALFTTGNKEVSYLYVLSNSSEFAEKYVCPTNVGFRGRLFIDDGWRHSEIFFDYGIPNLYDMAAYILDHFEDVNFNLSRNALDSHISNWGNVNDLSGGNFPLALNSLTQTCVNSGYSFFKMYSYEDSDYPSTNLLSDNNYSNLINNCPIFIATTDNTLAFIGHTSVYTGRGDLGSKFGDCLFPIPNAGIENKLYYPDETSLNHTEPRTVSGNLLIELNDIGVYKKSGLKLIPLDSDILRFTCDSSVTTNWLYQKSVPGVDDNFILDIKLNRIFNNIVDLRNGNIISEIISNSLEIITLDILHYILKTDYYYSGPYRTCLEGIIYIDNGKARYIVHGHSSWDPYNGLFFTDGAVTDLSRYFKFFFNLIPNKLLIDG